ncbi:hypothetical protein Tco_0704407 [Tanacetum coccineum]|uniref:Uncharacterized protein n=1 Tax=Tanacetum coccineum TaxID=301880 RepID=A0ABQ4Y331_9ASTR
MILFAHAFSGFEYVIKTVYVDYLNITGTHWELPKAMERLRRKVSEKQSVALDCKLNILMMEFYSTKKHTRKRCADAGYRSDPHNGRSQTEILAIHERGWLRNSIGESCDVYARNEDRQLYIRTTTCIAQLRERFIKGDRTKLIRCADAGYRSDPHNGRSQTGYVFSHGGTAIS